MYKIYVWNGTRPVGKLNKVMLWAAFALSIEAAEYACALRKREPGWTVYEGFTKPSKSFILASQVNPTPTT